MVLNLDEEKLARERGDSEESSSPLPLDRGGGTRTLSRLNFLRLGILGGFTVLGWRLWDMQKPLQEGVTNPAESQPPADTSFFTAKAPRGLIFYPKRKRLASHTATLFVTNTPKYLPHR